MFITQTIFADRHEAKQVGLRLRLDWMKSILVQIAPDIFSSINKDDFDLSTVTQRMLLNNLVKDNNLYIDDLMDGSMKIYVIDEKDEHILIGEWKKPLYSLRNDLNQKDPKKRIYNAIEISYWSIFDQEG